MKVEAVIAASILFAVPAMAEDHHTVSWYRAHPAETLAKMAACNNDPGYAAHDPNCENAHEARIAMSVDEGRREIGLMQKQEDDRRRQYLLANPQVLVNGLKYCNKLPTAETRRIMNCALVYDTGQQYLAANKGRQP